jgi:protein-S-isoprenylcysteine O-methyltransferase Ste14
VTGAGRALSIAGFVAMVVAILGLFYTRTLLSPSPIVIAAQVAAVALMLWARVTFGRRSFHAAADPTAGGIVTSGPYRFIRHPIYTAACLFCWAGIAASGSVVAVGWGLLLTAGAIVRMLVEERLLVERYPAYREYADTTRRMLPFVF